VKKRAARPALFMLLHIARLLSLRLNQWDFQKPYPTYHPLKKKHLKLNMSKEDRIFGKNVLESK
jgi:hypothetical protein